MRLQLILEGILKEEEDKKQIAAMNQAMQLAAAELAKLYKDNEAEIKQDVEQSEEEPNESLGAVAIIGFIGVT